MKILIAEDDAFLSSAYKIKLTKAGFELEMAQDGSEVMKKLASFNPDLIILDLIMPINDGFSTLEEIKADPFYKNIPIIVASNLSQKDDLEKAMQLGADSYIIKSDLSMEEIIQKIKTVINKTS